MVLALRGATLVVNGTKRHSPRCNICGRYWGHSAFSWRRPLIPPQLARPSLELAWSQGGNLQAERTCSARGSSEIDLFRDGQGVIDLDAEIPDGALYLGVAEQ